MLETIFGIVAALGIYKWIENNIDISITFNKKTHTVKKKSEKKEEEKSASIDDYETDELSKLNKEYVEKKHKVESNIKL